jgi:hypothetical protein
LIQTAAGAPERQTRAGIREAIQPSDADAKRTITAPVDVVGPLGWPTPLSVQGGEQEIKAQVPAGHLVRSEEQAHPRLGPESIRVCDPEPGLGWDLR